MRLLKTWIGLACALALTACGSEPVWQVKVAPGEGVLAVGLHTDRTLSDELKGKPSNEIELFYVGEGDYMSYKTLPVVQKDAVAVRSLAAKGYQLYKLKVGGRILNLEGGFEIKPDTVTYIGDLTIPGNPEKLEVPQVEDRYDAMRQTLVAKHGDLLKRFKLEKRLIVLRPAR
ncbi:MAG: hypothetical protein AB1400_08670 [Pseudomonadota bacterium]